MKSKTIKILVILITVLIILDQGSKLIVSNFLEDKDIGNDKIGINPISNTGMALGFNDGDNNKNIVMTIFILLIIGVFVKNQIERIDTKTAVALSLAISGGVSNLIDRIFRKGVYDFIKFYSITFNFADLFIIIGWILLIVFLIEFSRRKTEV